MILLRLGSHTSGWTTPKGADQLPWSTFASRLERPEDALARLDERVRNHPLGAGWTERAHFVDACAALWLEDLVLRDAAMDVRTAVDGTNRAMSVLRARRLVVRRGGAWRGRSPPAGLDTVRGRRTGSGNSVPAARERSELVYDRDWDEEERLAEWQEMVNGTDKLPTLAAAATVRFELLAGHIVVSGASSRRLD